MIRAVESPRSRTLPQLLDEMASRQPPREFIVGAEARLTYAETRTRVRRLAKGLYRLGVRGGEKVTLLMNNRTEWLLVDFAVTLLGATLVPISTWSRARELAYVLNHCDATTFITVDRFLGQNYLAMLAEIGAPGSDRLPQLRHVVSVGDARPAGMVPFEDLWNMGADVSDATLDACQHAVGPDDVAYILYTSGTTSTPKGVQLRHRGLIENTWHIGERQHLGPGDRMWMGISLFWSFGCLNALLAVMTHGGCIVLQEHFDAAAALALIERERCTVYYGTPNIALALWEHLPPLPADKVYQFWLIQGATPVSAGTFRADADGTGTLVIQAPSDLGSYSGLGLTAEPAPGVAAPTGPILASGPL